MGKKPVVDVKGGVAGSKDKVKGSVSTDVNLGALHGSSSAATEVGKSGFSTSKSDSSSLGGVLGSSHSQSTSLGSGGFSTNQSESHNVFGLKTGSSSHASVGKDGISFGEEAHIAGHNVGYSAHIPNPTGAMKSGLNDVKASAERAANNTPEALEKNAATFAEHTAKFAEDIGKWAEGLAGAVGGVIPDNIAEHARGFYERSGELCTDAGKLFGEGVAPLADGARSLYEMMGSLMAGIGNMVGSIDLGAMARVVCEVAVAAASLAGQALGFLLEIGGAAASVAFR